MGDSQHRCPRCGKRTTFYDDDMRICASLPGCDWHGCGWRGRTGGDVKADAGWCRWGFEPDGYVHIFNLYVHPPLRRQGHARRILHRAIAEIRAAGYDGDIIIVADPTDPTIDADRLGRFYASLGLKVYDYYCEEMED